MASISVLFAAKKIRCPSKKLAMIIETTGTPFKRVIVFLFAPTETFLECVKRKRLEMSESAWVKKIIVWSPVSRGLLACDTSCATGILGFCSTFFSVNCSIKQIKNVVKRVLTQTDILFYGNRNVIIQLGCPKACYHYHHNTRSV